MQSADVKRHHEEFCGFEAGIDFVRVDLAAHEKPGADQRDESERGFDDDQQAANRIVAPANGVAATAGLQRVGKIGRRSFPSRSRAEQRAGDECDAEREEQHVRIEREIDIVGFDEGWAIRPEYVASPVGDQQSDAGSCQRKQRALSEQLAKDSSAASAERGANGHLFVARRGLREQQVGEIGARDQQYEADCAHHHRASQSELIVLVDADGGFSQRRQRDASAGIFFWVFGFEARGDRFE